jgi:hypothetical protein
LGRPEGKNGRPTGGFLSLPACTNAESLELARASSLVSLRGVFLKVSAYWRGTFSHWM